jgi:hypothetical protein
MTFQGLKHKYTHGTFEDCPQQHPFWLRSGGFTATINAKIYDPGGSKRDAYEPATEEDEHADFLGFWHL